MHTCLGSPRGLVFWSQTRYVPNSLSTQLWKFLYESPKTLRLLSLEGYRIPSRRQLDKRCWSDIQYPVLHTTHKKAFRVILYFWGSFNLPKAWDRGFSIRSCYFPTQQKSSNNLIVNWIHYPLFTSCHYFASLLHILEPFILLWKWTDRFTKTLL